MPVEPLLRVRDLVMHFPARRRKPVVRAVDGVSFDIHRGEILGLIGESLLCFSLHFQRLLPGFDR